MCILYAFLSKGNFRLPVVGDADVHSGSHERLSRLSSLGGLWYSALSSVGDELGVSLKRLPSNTTIRHIFRGVNAWASQQFSPQMGEWLAVVAKASRGQCNTSGTHCRTLSVSCRCTVITIAWWLLSKAIRTKPKAKFRLLNWTKIDHSRPLLVFGKRSFRHCCHY